MGVTMTDEAAKKVESRFDNRAREFWEESAMNTPAGRYGLDQLPGWTITREQNGSPIIYDVRAIDHPFKVSGQARGRLIAWAERTTGVPPIDGAAVTRCAESLTEAEMRETEGGGRGTTEWDFDTPVSTPDLG
ncbi:MAG: hypothetical protein L0H93_18730 [Nocardioides sp.]|nr:hypothetical protein [Nocardioides sp.]